MSFRSRPAPSNPPRRTPAAQRGAAAITLLLLMLSLVAMLGLVEVGYLYWVKRDTQKVADLAALAGAQSLDQCTPAPARNGNQASSANSAHNGFEGELEVVCGRWSSNAPETVDPNVEDAQVDAVQVTATAPAIPFFGQALEQSLSISSKAIARQSIPVASFWVGTRLASLESSPTCALIRSIGLDICDQVGLTGYDTGLASATVTPSGLLKALGVEVPADIGVGELNQLLSAEVGAKTLVEVLDATVVAAGGSRELLDLNATLVDTIGTALNVSELNVALGSDAQTSGIFASITNTSANAALNTEINALDVLSTAIAVATRQHALEINELNAAVPGLTELKVSASLIEPPSIAIGGVGASAYTGQLRTYVNAKASTSNIPIIGSLLSVRLDLPIMIDAVTAKATAQEMCTSNLRTSDGRDRARFSVNGAVLNVCIGKPVSEGQIFSKTDACENNIQSTELLNISLLGTNLASIKGQVHVPALPVAGEVILQKGETKQISTSLNLGTTVKNITDALLGLLIGSSINEKSTLSDVQATSMAGQLWGSSCGTTDRNCRVQKITKIKNEIDDSVQGLQGPIADLLGNTLGITSDLLTLDLISVLQGVGSLVNDLLGTVGNLLGNLLSPVTGNACTGGGLLNLYGSDTECKAEIKKTLLENSSASGVSEQNAVLALLGFALQTLSPILDALGEKLLTPLLENVLGLDLGEIDVGVEDLQCKTGASLVY